MALKSYKQKSSMYVLSKFGAACLNPLSIALKAPYKRNMEKEADVDGLLLMARTGFNPLKAMSVWKKMMKMHGNLFFGKKAKY